MKMYTNFAEVYDLFMDNVPYELWTKQLINIFLDHDIKKGVIADLGCGTGSITQLLAEKGYDMIGIDNSEDMLSLAMDKKMESGLDILYTCQDMRDFELYGTCAAMVSRCDAVNYLEKYDDLVSMFRTVNNYLDPHGIFVFDCNSLYKYEHVLADNTIAENRDEGSFIWENSYDEITRTNEYDLTLYIKHGEDNSYRRFEETHIQKAYTLDEYKKAVIQAGMIWGEAVDADTLNAPSDVTERYLITVCENGKDIDKDE